MSARAGHVVQVLRWLSAELAAEKHALAHVPAQLARALLEDPAAGSCRLCGGALPAVLGRGRPRVRCESCSPPRRKVAANSTLALADSPQTDHERGAA